MPEKEKDKAKCEKCGEKDSVNWSEYCGCRICNKCGHHQGLARCYCGWALDSGNGREQLEDMGERIDEED